MAMSVPGAPQEAWGQTEPACAAHRRPRPLPPRLDSSSALLLAGGPSAPGAMEDRSEALALFESLTGAAPHVAEHVLDA